MARQLSPDQKAVFKLLKRLVPTAMEDQKTIGREMGLLKRLRQKYPDMAFWNEIKPAVTLDTLLYFCGQYGSEQIDAEWKAYQIGLAEKERAASAALDREIALLEDLINPIDLDTESKVNRVKKQSSAQWADSCE